MKILMVSMFAPHFFNWTELLRGSEHEVFWLDVFDSNTYVPQLDFVTQISGWRYKKDYPGRYSVKQHLPRINRFINKFNERDLNAVLEEKIREIKPDVIHSFVMFIAGYPILKTMKKFPHLKWVYSAWGSDMFFLLGSEVHQGQGKKVLPELDFMFSDCKRDHRIAVENGFKGEFLGVYPGGGGFDFDKTDPLMLPEANRSLILIKGYQGELGRCLEVLKALERLKINFMDCKIVVFGAHPEVINYVEHSDLSNWSNFKAYAQIPQLELMKFMGQAKIYIGNSISDGMPNTLLEALVMGAFPVQSDPGGATAEKIKNGFNGILIRDPENIDHIRNILEKLDPRTFSEGINYNLRVLKPLLNRKIIRSEVLHKYQKIEATIELGNG